MSTIYQNLNIKASLEKVYDAISDPKRLVNWWPLKCTGKPEIGALYNLNFTGEYDWYGKVVACEPQKSFHIKMTESDVNWDSTTFGFELAEHKNGVYVAFSHKNWLEENDHFKYSSFCWAILLKGLRDYIEKGNVIPFENRE